MKLKGIDFKISLMTIITLKIIKILSVQQKWTEVNDESIKLLSFLQ
jgi:hypothetical protein